MSENNTPATMEEAYEPEKARIKKWSEFVELTALDFFQECELEKMTLEDGNGNKAKFSRTKDNEVKLEHSSTRILG